MLPSLPGAHASEQLDPQCSMQTYHSPYQPQLGLHYIAYKLLLFFFIPVKVGGWVGWAYSRLASCSRLHTNYSGEIWNATRKLRVRNASTRPPYVTLVTYHTCYVCIFYALSEHIDSCNFLQSFLVCVACLKHVVILCWQWATMMMQQSVDLSGRRTLLHIVAERVAYHRACRSVRTASMLAIIPVMISTCSAVVLVAPVTVEIQLWWTQLGKFVAFSIYRDWWPRLIHLSINEHCVKCI